MGYLHAEYPTIRLKILYIVATTTYVSVRASNVSGGCFSGKLSLTYNKGLIFSPDTEVKFIKLVRLEVTSSYIRSLLEGGTPHRLLTVLVL